MPTDSRAVAPQADGSSALSVQLTDGRRYTAALPVAADSRFPSARRQRVITQQLTGHERPAWPLTLLSHRTD